LVARCVVLRYERDRRKVFRCGFPLTSVKSVRLFYRVSWLSRGLTRLSETRSLVASLARPGSNLTGFSNLTIELTPKRLELLCELVRRATVITLLVNPDNKMTEPYIRAMQEAARVKGIQLPILRAGTEAEIDTAFASLGQLQAGGLVVAADAFFVSRREQLVALASRYAVPATYEGRMFTAVGGLIGYGIDNVAVTRQGGVYAGRILSRFLAAHMAEVRIAD
jgi:putative ABC transport system substrate-binding protein